MARTIENSTTISAPPQGVWSVLVDFPARAAWDPYYRDVRGEPVKGARLEVRASLGEGRRLVRTHPRITDVDPHTRLVWVNRFALPGLLDSRQELRLRSLHPGVTELHQSERFTGMLSPLVARTLDAVEVRLGEWVLAVKQRAEALASPAKHEIRPGESASLLHHRHDTTSHDTSRGTT